MRGHRGAGRHAGGGPRSIPACAGPPRSSPPLPRQTEVYPRVCGATRQKGPHRRRCHGLSPRVRGHPVIRLPNGAYRRSIPACAGPPRTPRRSPPPSRVYPRVCGATREFDPRRVRTEGLSPRVRGHPSSLSSSVSCPGSIPACAGPPSRRCSRGEGPWVYPRVCGATHRIGVRCEHLQGLSPRVRGHQARRVDRHAPLRSIPACAGPPSVTTSACRVSSVYPRVCGATS